MTVGVLEIHAADIVVPVDFSAAVLARVCPILQTSIADAGKGLIEVVFAYQEGVMLGGNLAIVFVEVEGNVVVELDDQHWSESGGGLQAQNFREECCRFLLIAAPDDSMV
jgi:hypothetical protein